jgi:hypothetical protein
LSDEGCLQLQPFLASLPKCSAARRYHLAQTLKKKNYRRNRERAGFEGRSAQVRCCARKSSVKLGAEQSTGATSLGDGGFDAGGAALDL